MPLPMLARVPHLMEPVPPVHAPSVHASRWRSAPQVASVHVAAAGFGANPLQLQPLLAFRFRRVWSSSFLRRHHRRFVRRLDGSKGAWVLRARAFVVAMQSCGLAAAHAAS